MFYFCSISSFHKKLYKNTRAGEKQIYREKERKGGLSGVSVEDAVSMNYIRIVIRQMVTAQNTNQHHEVPLFCRGILEIALTVDIC